ncbi:MAG: RCC1 domain-containing protein [Dietzia sp.]
MTGISGITKISVGYLSTCATLQDGTAHCWGNNHSAALGGGDALNGIDSSPEPVNVHGLTDVVDISASHSMGSASHGCAVLDSGSAYCWGANNERQGGYDTNVGSAVPLHVERLTEGLEISTGGTHTCVLRRDSTARCWGAENYFLTSDTSPLGREFVFHQGETGRSWNPPESELMKGLTAISAGSLHTCAALQDGAVICWGRNREGQLGNGTEDSSKSPVRVLLPGTEGDT